MFTAKIIELGKAPIEVALDGNSATIYEVAKVAGVRLASVQINGRDVNDSHRVYDGDRIFNNLKKIKGNTDYVEVKFIQIGSAKGVQTIAVAPGTSIKEAARAAGVNVDGFELRVNSSTSAVEDTYLLTGDSRVILGKKVKGNINPIEVKFIQIGSAKGVQSVAVENGTSIADAAALAEVNVDGFELRVNSSTAAVTGTYILNGDSRVILGKKVKGNDQD